MNEEVNAPSESRKEEAQGQSDSIAPAARLAPPLLPHEETAASISAQLAKLALDIEALAASAQAKEEGAKGNRTSVWWAALGVLLTSAAPLLGPYAGKEQAATEPMYRIFASTFAKDVDAASTSLREASTLLPNGHHSSLNAKVGEVVLALIKSYDAAIRLQASQGQLASFVPLLHRDFEQQAAAGVLSAKGYGVDLKKVDKGLKEVSSCLDRLDSRRREYIEAIEQGTKSPRSAQVYVLVTRDLGEYVKGSSVVGGCVQISSALASQVQEIVTTHDAGVQGFNEAAARMSLYLKLLFALGTAFLFVHGRPASSWLLSRFATRRGAVG